ncbi:MAG: hypothetical protein KAI25_15840 [Hyphomicrobiaceae bacterium]|nr:hypothetical protein [Hyphomicrobiaceae bacterium]
MKRRRSTRTYTRNHTIEEYTGWFNQPSRANKYKVDMPILYEYDGLKKIISDGDVGVSQTALLVAAYNGLDTGGTASPAFRTIAGDDAQLRDTYHLTALSKARVTATRTPAYPLRCMANVDEADGTLVFTHHRSSGLIKIISYARAGTWPPYHRVPIVPVEKGVVYKPVLRIHLASSVCETAGAERESSISTIVSHIAAFLADHRVAVLNVAGHRNESATFPTFLSVVETILDRTCNHSEA